MYKITLEAGEEVILKIPFTREKLYRESKMLQRISCILPAPCVLDLWTGDETTSGAILLSFIDGAPCLDQQVDKPLSFRMGELLATLHTVSMPGFGHEGEHGFTYVDWWDFINTKVERILANSEGHLSPTTFQKVHDHFQHFSTHHPQADGPCAVHSDYRPGNILVQNGQITGLIDFESARGGSADFDFSKMKLYVWDELPGTREAFEEGYTSIRPLPHELDTLLHFNLLFHAINGIDFCVKRGITGNEHFLRESIRTVEKIVREL